MFSSGTLLNSLFANGNYEFIFVGGQVFRQSTLYKNQVKLEWVKTVDGIRYLNSAILVIDPRAAIKIILVATGDAAMIWH